MGYWNLLVSQARNERPGDRAAGAFSEYARFRCALSRAIADGINIGEARLQRFGLYWNITVLGHVAVFEEFRRTDRRNTEENVVGKFAAIVEGDDPAFRIHRLHFAVGDERDVALGEGGEQGTRCFRRWRNRNFQWENECDFTGVADSTSGEVIVHHERRFAG